MTNYLDIERLASLTRSKRSKRGLKEVAREAGISSPSAIFRVEEGKIPNMATFQALCVWLNISPTDLVENYSPGEKLHSREREQNTFVVKNFETATRLTGEEMSTLLGIDRAVQIDDSGTEQLAIQVLKRLNERGLSEQWYWCKYEQCYLKRSEYPIRNVLEHCIR
jgi:transcriptional regulator with XRE-family HTH domain